MKLHFRVFALLCASLAIAPVIAQKENAPAPSLPPARVPPYELFQKYTEGILAPDAKDLRVGPDVTGYAGLWRGRPWFEPLFWCTQMANAQNQRDADGKDPALTKLAGDLYLDGYERYEADRGVAIDKLTGKNPMALLLISLRLSYKRDTGQTIDSSVCMALHRDYTAATSVVKPYVRTTPAAAAIPYTSADSPLKIDAKDLRIAAANGSLTRWRGHVWHEPLLWCTALNMAKYQAHPSDETRQIIVQDLLLSGNRVARDRGVSLDEIGATVRGQAEFMAKQMVQDNFTAKPQFADREGDCTDIITSYKAIAAK